MSQSKSKISELEKMVVEDKKWSLVDTLNPLVAWIEEMKKSFTTIFWTNHWENKISISMDKYENKWFKS